MAGVVRNTNDCDSFGAEILTRTSYRNAVAGLFAEIVKVIGGRLTQVLFHAFGGMQAGNVVIKADGSDNPPMPRCNREASAAKPQQIVTALACKHEHGLVASAK